MLTGDDLLAQGIPRGRSTNAAGQRVRAVQLDGALHDKAEALAMVEKWQVERGVFLSRVV